MLDSPHYALAGDDAPCVQYLPCQVCYVVITDLACFFFTPSDVSITPENIRLSIAYRKQPRFWTPTNTPSTALFGDFSKVYPAMPFTKPYTLKRGHRLELIIQNKNEDVINNAYATVRGVKLCDY